MYNRSLCYTSETNIINQLYSDKKFLNYLSLNTVLLTTLLFIINRTRFLSHHSPYMNSKLEIQSSGKNRDQSWTQMEEILCCVLTNNTATRVRSTTYLLYVFAVKKNCKTGTLGRGRRLIPSGVPFTWQLGGWSSVFSPATKRKSEVCSPKPSLLGSDRTFWTSSKKKKHRKTIPLSQLKSLEVTTLP